ncbi:MAG: hypothetical protein A2010_12835 [Nitrospirae bacterium GWD2_57_9]|nr:MAG: hypothetical protein A2010_12835 [Nitrospirae bacterium GWD2_57_9]
MKRHFFGNQTGEVVTGVMVAIMVVMMLFGGMHMMHGDRDRRHGDDRDKSGHKHDHQKEGMHHMHNDGGEHSGAHEEGK